MQLKDITLNNDYFEKFIDISYEDWREYQYKDGKTIRILSPKYLVRTKKGLYFIIDKTDIAFFIPENWNAIIWRPED